MIEILDVVKRKNSWYRDIDKLWEIIGYDDISKEFEITDGWKYRYELEEDLIFASRSPHTNV